jgi:hypothetical protein
MTRDGVKGVLALLTMTLYLAWVSGTAERVALVAAWIVIGSCRWWWLRRSTTKAHGRTETEAQ